MKKCVFLPWTKREGAIVTEKEYERKAIVGREKYDMLLAEFTGKYPREDILQINHYYDTPDFALYQSGETLRVRQIEITLMRGRRFAQRR